MRDIDHRGARRYRGYHPVQDPRVMVLITKVGKQRDRCVLRLSCGPHARHPPPATMPVKGYHQTIPEISHKGMARWAKGLFGQHATMRERRRTQEGAQRRSEKWAAVGEQEWGSFLDDSNLRDPLPNGAQRAQATLRGLALAVALSAPGAPAALCVLDECLPRAPGGRLRQRRTVGIYAPAAGEVRPRVDYGRQGSARSKSVSRPMCGET